MFYSGYLILKRKSGRKSVLHISYLINVFVLLYFKENKEFKNKFYFYLDDNI